MKKLLVICGPTASGKTSLGIHLAKRLDGEVVSADSRQVYKGLDVGTGKDIPKNAKCIFQNRKLGGYFLIKGIRVWGYDLIEAKKEFSVAQYTKIARNIIDDIHKRNKLPILVGGTGLYIKSVISGIDTVSIPKNKNLRKKIEGKDVKDLFENLALLDPVKAGSMNQSDKKNPRRLIRAIEIATWRLSKGGIRKTRKIMEYDTLYIGLNAFRKVLYTRIEKRIKKRMKGLKEEISQLIDKGVSWEDQSMSSLGYQQWKEFFTGKRSEEDVLSQWKSEEKRYSKRQLTWFKRQKNINWFDINSREWLKKVESLVKKWYKVANVKEN